MKKSFLSVLLALVLCLSLLPTTALAAEVTVKANQYGNIEQDSDYNYPTGVSFDNGVYILDNGYDYTFDGALSSNVALANNGTIIDGQLGGRILNNENGIIQSGTFNALVTNYGTINGGTFNGKILNMGGTVVNGVRGTVAQGGSLDITKQKLGSENVGDITVKQNSVDIPSGKAGEIYNVAGFDDTLVGLYLLKEGESAPTEDFSIDTDVFTAVEFLGTVIQYNFTMPDYPVTVCAVFSDYVPK